MTERVYLDWNASAPLRSEARAAMVRAMEITGNPSSVHAEGRAARALVEEARADVAALADCDPSMVVFTSGATEAAALGLAGRDCAGSPFEHDCVDVWLTKRDAQSDQVRQVANPETGIMSEPGTLFADAVQAVGRTGWRFDGEMAALSAHKLGGPKGVGALLVRGDIEARTKGGGQELGRRAGTENLIGIAGFGAAARAVQRDFAGGQWDAVRERRIWLEEALCAANPDAIIVGQGEKRLPNTICVITEGWLGETQVMAMDLAGFAISAGSACASGKVGPSRVLRAMGFSDRAAQSSIRVSLGPTTTQTQVEAFARAWDMQFKRWRARAA